MITPIKLADGQGSVHVLIVGVAEAYGFEPLKGLGSSVKRLYDWWRDKASARLPQGMTLGSVSVLLSTDEQFRLEADSGHFYPERATLANVQKAFGDWMAAAVKGGHGFVYWAGHGAKSGFGDRAPGLSLYCSDTRARLGGGEPLPTFIDWSLTHASMNVFADTVRFSCFVDCCQGPPLDQLAPTSALPGQPVSQREHWTYQQFSTSSGELAFSWPHPVSETDFHGGPLGTAAFLDVLDRFGVHQVNLAANHYATPYSLSRAVGLRMEHIAAHIKPLTHLKLPRIADMLPDEWESQMIMTIPKPQYVVEVFPPAGFSVGSFEHCRVTPKGTDNSIPVLKHSSSWRATADHGAHTVELKPIVGKGLSTPVDITCNGPIRL